MIFQTYKFYKYLSTIVPPKNDRMFAKLNFMAQKKKKLTVMI